MAVRVSVAKLSCNTHHLFQPPVFRKLCSSLGGGEKWVWTRASFVPRLKQYHLNQASVGSIQKGLYLNCDWCGLHTSQHYAVLNASWLCSRMTLGVGTPEQLHEAAARRSCSPLGPRSGWGSDRQPPLPACRSHSQNTFFCDRCQQLAWDALPGTIPLAGAGILLPRLYCSACSRRWCLGGMCDTGAGRFQQQGGQRSALPRCGKTSTTATWSQPMPFVCMGVKAGPVREANKPSSRTHNETRDNAFPFWETMLELVGSCLLWKWPL